MPSKHVARTAESFGFAFGRSRVEDMEGPGGFQDDGEGTRSLGAMKLDMIHVLSDTINILISEMSYYIY